MVSSGEHAKFVLLINFLQQNSLLEKTAAEMVVIGLEQNVVIALR